MAAQTLADAAVRIGFQAQAFPYFGAERRGAPVEAYARIDNKKIRTKSQVYEPHLVVIMDASLMDIVNATAGLRPGGKAGLNTVQRPEEADLGAGVDAELGTVDALSISPEMLKMPVVNTAMLGAVAKVWDVVPLDAIMEAIEDRFGSKLGRRAGMLNAEAAKRAFEDTVVGRASGRREHAEHRRWLPAWDEMPIGASLRRTAQAEEEVGPATTWQHHTGRWKWSTPLYKKEKCIKCLRCWWSCPDAAIVRLDDDHMRWELDYCKGCGICADICPVNEIDMMEGARDTWQ